MSLLPGQMMEMPLLISDPITQAGPARMIHRSLKPRSV